MRRMRLWHGWNTKQLRPWVSSKVISLKIINPLEGPGLMGRRIEVGPQAVGDWRGCHEMENTSDQPILILKLSEVSMSGLETWEEVNIWDDLMG